MDNTSQTTPESGTPAANADLTGQALGDFRILRKLGQGGMGQVYLAEQVSLKRKVALKILRVELAVNETSLKRFKMEAEAVARVTHANIVQVYAIGECQGLHFMALEYVEGRNLRDYLARKGSLEVLQAISIIRQVASALQRAGELGIIHRDIKPENILLTRKSEVKVADFGLSRCLEPGTGGPPALNLTQSGVTMGTPLYMSPEQVEGKPLDARTDIYSLGVSCYHMLAGEPPYKGASAFEVALQHVRGEPVPLDSVRPDLPPDLCAIVHKMMAKDPAQRYQTCRELIKDLARVRVGLNGVTGVLPIAETTLLGQSPPTGQFPSTAPTTVAPEVARSSASPRGQGAGRRWVMAAFVLTLVFGLAGGAALGVWRQRTRSPATPEEKETVAGPATEASPLQEREQALKKAVEWYIDPSNGYKNSSTGARVCLDLAIPYLEQNRLDEAEKLFQTLEGIHQEAIYQTLGQLGRAIVLALRGKQVESNQLFKQVPNKGGGPRARGVFMDLIRSNRPLNKWIAEAVHHNHINGVRDRDVPPYLSLYLQISLRQQGETLPPRKDRPGAGRRPPS